MKKFLMIFTTMFSFFFLLSFFNRSTAEELKVGDDAPDFTLKGSDGKTYSLKDYRGKKGVVLAWFPKAFTPGCTTQCTLLAKEGKKLKDYDVAYFTASIDTPEKNKEFAESLDADYPILSDPEKTVAKAYGVLDGLLPYAKRWTFYISPEGKILHIDKSIKVNSTVDDTVKNLEELKLGKKKTKRKKNKKI